VAYVEQMESIASQTSDVRAWELARDIMCPLLDNIFRVHASSNPIEHVFSHGGIMIFCKYSTVTLNKEHFLSIAVA